MPDSPADVPFEIDVHDLKKMMDAGDDFLLVDCRQPDEHETCRIEGSVLIPRNEVEDRIGELGTDTNRTIVVHCHHGGRSSIVTDYLRGQGYSGAQNLAGGIEAWSQQIDPSVPRY